MNETPAVIDNLVQELSPVKPIRSTFVFTGFWLLTCVFLLTLLARLAGPFRQSALSQLSHYPLFTADLFLGSLAFAVFATGVFRMIIPGLKTQRYFICGLGLLALWIAVQCLGLIYGEAILPASMDGKRDHCFVEGLLMAVPAILFGLYLANKGYVLNRGNLIVGLSLCAGLIPAWIMQFACMYEANHNLYFHFGPVALTVLAASAIDFLIKHKKKSSTV